MTDNKVVDVTERIREQRRVEKLLLAPGTDAGMLEAFLAMSEDDREIAQTSWGATFSRFRRVYVDALMSSGCDPLADLFRAKGSKQP